MIEHLSSEHFAEQARGALQNDELRGALARASDLFAERREAAVGSMPNWEELREQARGIKAETLERLDEYLEQFVEKAEAAGMRVHWAVDGTEACEIVARLARDRVAHTIVKSKSMTTEEIGLNEMLEDLGLVPIETDLGEWIVQLAGEKPSHIIVPAIHKTREQIARLFQERLGTPLTNDVHELAETARGILRKAFADADMGVSGVNFAIAETGSFLVLENEGNARMTTTLPRVHVAIMGIEKILPRMADLEVFLRLLPRSGTGQHLTSYQTIFTGPDAHGEGPEEIHIVLLDLEVGNVVYVFSGSVTPDDIDGTDDAVATIEATQNAVGDYVYRTLINPGAYTVAFTCEGGNDDPEAADEITFLNPVGTTNPVTNTGNATTVNF
jgi:L-lactate dehydrogenase complex protein LldF